MDFWKCTSSRTPSLSTAPLSFSNKLHEKADFEKQERALGHAVDTDVDIDIREIYFLIMHFLSAGPCQRTFGQFWNEVLEHQLLPRRYHAWFSRSGVRSGDDDDDGSSFPLSYDKLVERYSYIEKDHLVKLLKQLMLTTAPPVHSKVGGNAPRAADVPTLLGTGSFSLLNCDKNKEKQQDKPLPAYMRWPHMQANQVHGLSLREIGGGFTKHHRAPSNRSACYAIVKPSTMVQKMQNIKKLRGHRDAVYCAIFDRSGRYVITGSDDRLVKIWSMETALCLASCRGHEGDITDLAVSSNNALVASSSNDFVIRVWRLPDGMPISVLRGHTGAVTAIAFSPRPTAVYQLLSASDDGTCRLWDARYSQCSPRIYLPKPSDSGTGKSNGPIGCGPSSSNGPQSRQILCCAYNANGTVFVTGSSDTFARVWNACKSNMDESEQPVHEMDVLSGHENDVNYVQFSGCAVASRSSTADTFKEENIPKFKNSWFCHDYIVTCSRDGSAIIWVPRSRRSHGKSGRWTRAYHLKVPPPPLPPQPPRGGPRQRFLPTPRGVNMIVWSLDNRFVLAAIMDCRICVWNAADGSLVHSLTGHSASSYVLDVHPFNPRIAMSAGYDGKTIVWDIWEGTPIRIYDIGRFKLVDGKFSPDGTSIVLSDDVGQIYLLNTGQGESQKDAKYDQFFLGDYRPLIRDTLGNVIDQESQLVPHVRNIQDPLCDSSMSPYPEPYQTMFQKRRLGALGIEWRPASIKFTVGPDFSLGYQMLPLADLERIIEPLPEFVDAMYWEPENEVISDDNDSEYNIAEEYSSGGHRGSVRASSSSEPECSSGDSDVEFSNKDALRRSRRKKHNTKELMTSSGRRVKKRTMDEHDGATSGSRRTKKSKIGRKALKNKSSNAKSLRPQRVAARNAQNMFSRITGTSTDGENEDDLEDESSDSESGLQNSNIEYNESDGNWQKANERCINEEQSSSDEFKDTAKPPVLPESQSNFGNRKIVLKLSLRDSKKSVPSEDARPRCDSQADLVDPSSRTSLETVEEKSIAMNFNRNDFTDRGQPETAEDHMEASAGDKENKIKWGEVKIRTSKRSRSGDVMPTHASSGWNAKMVYEKNRDDISGDEEQIGTDALQYLDCGTNKEFAPSYEKHKFLSIESSHLGNQSPRVRASAASSNDNSNEGYKDLSGSGKCRDYDSQEIDEGVGTNHSHELKENPPLKLTKLRIKLKNSTKLKFVSPVGDLTSRDNLMSESPSSMERNLTSGVIEGVGDARRSSSFQLLHSDSEVKTYKDVQKMEKSYKAKTDFENFDGGMEENTNSANHHDSRTGVHEAVTDEICRRRSLKIKATSLEPNAMNHNSKLRERHESAGTSKNAQISFVNARGQLLSEEVIPSSKIRVRSSSSRNKLGGYNENNPSSSRRRANYTVKKISWLMLSEHEESYRYIPQLGDEVVYLRQGHEGLIESSSSSEPGPWRSIKGNLSAVEICKVEDLKYATVSGSGESCCKITLKFADPSSCAFGKDFNLTLPELISFPDFLVEKTRYEAAVSRNWTRKDKCLVWWRNENGEGGSWWEGQILSLQPKSTEFPDSPWEGYEIQYKTDLSSNHFHCPWELHDPNIPWEHPHIDFEIKNKLLSLFDKLERSVSKHQDYYGFQKLNQVAQKSDFYNRFPVPLYPELIQLRLENNYYRSLEAVKHDISVMLANAKSYFARNEELSIKMRCLSDWFSSKLLRLQRRLT